MTERFIVVVGKDSKEIPVITSVATRSAKYFQIAMEHDWKEAGERRVELSHTTVEVFEGYLQWLYTGQITVIGNNEHNAMAQYFILGDYLDDPKFRGVALDGIMSTFLETNLVPGSVTVKLAWSETPPNSLLRQLISELWLTTRFSYALAWLLEPSLDPASKRSQYPK